MSDKGAMIELHVDRRRITTLAPLHAQTPLEEVLVVAPREGEFAAIADWLQGELEQRGSSVMDLDQAQCWNPEGLGSTVIALGHAANNMLLRSLHYLGFLENADYPSEGLRVRSVHNPYGDGANVLCALGYTAEACRASAERLMGQLEGGAPAAPLHLRGPAMETADPAEWLPCLDGLDEDATGTPLLLHPMRLAAQSGEERWARAFIAALEPYASGRVPLTFAKMCHVDFWTADVVTAWDALEELPFFTDDERLMATNFLLACAEYCQDSITYQKWRITEEDHQIFNHHTFPAMGLFFSCLYLQRHGYQLPEADGWLRKSLKVFARAATAGRSFDEGGSGYNWLVGNHLLKVALAAGDASYARSEKMCSYADLAATIMNNAFEMVPYGDCGSFHITGTAAGQILLRAAEGHGDAGYKWLAEQHSPADAAADVFTRELPSCHPEAQPKGLDPSGAAAPPPQDDKTDHPTLRKHLGLFVLPMDPVIHRWGYLPRFPNYPPPPLPPTVPPQQGFDKLSLRGGWEPTDDYLLLQGMGFGQHAHPDANSILQYQARGRLFLAESDYIRRMPKQHNMVMVIRDGEHGDIPVTARLDQAFEFTGGAFVQSTLPDYNGCDWQRTMVWLRNDCVVVVDTLTAKEAGEYELRCYWRTLAEAKLTDQGLHTIHDGEHFHIIEAGQSVRRVDGETIQMRVDTEDIGLGALDYAPYNFGSGAPQILRQTQRLHLEAGEQACFINLLLPNGQVEEPRRRIQWKDGRLLLTGEGRSVVVSEDGFEVEDTGSHVFAEGERLGVLSREVGGVRTACGSGEPRSIRSTATALWEVALTAPATALASLLGPRASSPQPFLVGCQDGLIAEVSVEGVVRELARADGKIGAVLTAALWGEEELTYLAASYDCTLRMLRPDGTERVKLALPRNSHMPACGKALCVADLDGDGKLWPIVGTQAWRVHPITPEGELRWIFDTTAHGVTAVAAGDLNHDGRDEIAVGTVYFCVPAVTPDGLRLWEDEDYNDFWNAGPLFPFVRIGDVDGDGDLEVITAGSDTLIHCIDRFGVKKWTTSIGDEPRGLVLVPMASTAGAGEPPALLEMGIVAASGTGDVHLVDGRGERVWRYGDETPCTALCGGATLCVAREDGRVEWLSLEGKVVAETQLAAPAAQLLAIGGDIIAATTDGRLVCLRP